MTQLEENKAILVHTEENKSSDEIEFSHNPDFWRTIVISEG
jgi:hypothetical protein